MESTLSTFVALDGDNIAVQDWPLEDRATVRGMVLLLHGLGEHAGHYDARACQLNDWGFAVRGYDQYGHGQSGGVRGSVPSDTRLLDDLTDMVDSTRTRMPSNMPLILLGHGLGGLVAALFVAQAIRPVQALVLSSPTLNPGLGRAEAFGLAVLSSLTPHWRVCKGMTGRLARFVAEGGPVVLKRAASWQVPTLLLSAGIDQTGNPAESRTFVSAAPKAVVTEGDISMLKPWLDARF